MAADHAPRARERIAKDEASLRRRAHAGIRALSHDVDELLNFIAFSSLDLASAVLPRSWALSLADAIGILAALSPVGRRAATRMGAMFGATKAVAIARERLTRPFRDHVIMARIANEREGAGNWRIESLNEPALLRDPNATFIVAAGHLARESSIAAYLPTVVPHKLAAVMAPVHKHGSGMRGLRLNVQFGRMADALKRVRNGDVEIVEVGQPRIVQRLVTHLKQTGACVFIAADAPWPSAKGGVARPFAGRALQNYALGTARLARMSQRPIISCVPVLEEGRIVLHWGAPIAPPASDDQSADTRITHALLDELERAIGRHPGQYVLSIGHERRWDGEHERWLAPAAEAVAQAEDMTAEHVAAH